MTLRMIEVHYLATQWLLSIQLCSAERRKGALTAEEQGALKAHDTKAPYCNSFASIGCLTHCWLVHVIVDVPVRYVVKALGSSATEHKSLK